MGIGRVLLFGITFFFLALVQLLIFFQASPGIGPNNNTSLTGGVRFQKYVYKYILKCFFFCFSTKTVKRVLLRRIKASRVFTCRIIIILPAKNCLNRPHWKLFSIFASHQVDLFSGSRSLAARPRALWLRLNDVCEEILSRRGTQLRRVKNLRAR